MRLETAVPIQCMYIDYYIYLKLHSDCVKKKPFKPESFLSLNAKRMYTFSALYH